MAEESAASAIDAEIVDHGPPDPQPDQGAKTTTRKRRTVTVPADLIVTEQRQPAETPTSLVRLAVEQNFDIEKLEKLLQLQRDWQREEARKAFFSALSKFQSEIPPILKSGSVDAGRGGKRKFASLGVINEAIRPWLYANGLSFRFAQSQGPAGITVTCIVSHSDGHSEETTLTAGADVSGGKNAIQSIGSTITYLERYTLVGALGLTTVDDDDDGNQGQAETQDLAAMTGEQRRAAAMEAARQAAQAASVQSGPSAEQSQTAQQSAPAIPAATPAPAPTAAMITNAQTAEMLGLMRKLFASGVAASEWLMQQAQTPSPATLTESQAVDVLVRLNQMAAAALQPAAPGPSPDPGMSASGAIPGSPTTAATLATSEQRLTIRDLTVRAYTLDAGRRQADWLQMLGHGKPEEILFREAEERIAYLEQVVGDVPF